jgi:hypothetical protein
MPSSPFTASVLHKANNLTTLFDSKIVPSNKKVCLCYTTSNNTYYYKSHSAKGMVSRTTAGYIGQRFRI